MTSPEIIVVGGPNGSGKTTFISELIAERSLPYLGADAIAAELSPNDPAAADIAAGRELIRRLDERLAAGDSFVVETTLSGKTFRQTVERAAVLNYDRKLVFVYALPVDVCVHRVRERVHKGGHDIPDEDIRRRHSRSLSNFWSVYRHLFGHWLLIDNSSTSPHEVAIGTSDSFVVSDEELFKVFSEAVSNVDNS